MYACKTKVKRYSARIVRRTTIHLSSTNCKYVCFPPTRAHFFLPPPLMVILSLVCSQLNAPPLPLTLSISLSLSFPLWYFPNHAMDWELIPHKRIRSAGSMLADRTRKGRRGRNFDNAKVGRALSSEQRHLLWLPFCSPAFGTPPPAPPPPPPPPPSSFTNQSA